MKKGFSLIELMAVIALLGIIITLASISMTSFKKNSEDRLKEEKIQYIETGAIKWGEDNLNNLSSACNYVNVSTLIDNNYIVGDNDNKNSLMIPGTSETFNNNCVCVKYEDVFSGKNLENYSSNYHGNTNYQVTATYGEGECN